MAQVNLNFHFNTVTVYQAEKDSITLDNEQKSLIAQLEVTGRQLLQGLDITHGLYIWGCPGRGKSYIIDNFYSSLPIKNKKRVHFHQFFQDIHQRLNSVENKQHGLDETIDDVLLDCSLLFFDEFHLHDSGDSVLIKWLLEHLFRKGITLVVTSNYPPDMLLPNQLYHHLFIPSINLIKKHMQTVELTGYIDYREYRHTQQNAFSDGLFLICQQMKKEAIITYPK
ncbi:cell division protein ZapE [Klebsiella aerogenes]|uniref:cell division protein ZapE n=1 Tax=Klebsiella aerogenes TaxID=548 RepID=UPI0024477B5C|nr:cell division protein ZapE [Klebsiella aerogenes]MDH1612237.1 cell division protein ZapE [Klebsiella aerogenes]